MNSLVTMVLRFEHRKNIYNTSFFSIIPIHDTFIIDTHSRSNNVHEHMPSAEGIGLVPYPVTH